MQFLWRILLLQLLMLPMLHRFLLLLLLHLPLLCLLLLPHLPLQGLAASHQERPRYQRVLLKRLVEIPLNSHVAVLRHHWHKVGGQLTLVLPIVPLIVSGTATASRRMSSLTSGNPLQSKRPSSRRSG
jgi:hypothetical protein